MAQPEKAAHAAQSALSEENIKDPYQILPSDIEKPPTTLLGSLKRIGPGLILSASIVGSGELIATTTLGAQAGYTMLWIILLSCFLKPIIQAEMGRYTIASGETGLAGFNQVPGPRAKVNWIVWAWVLMTLLTLLQVGAMYGGVSQVLNLLIPTVPVSAWVLVMLGITLALLLGGGYDRIEKLATVKVGLFTLLTALAAMVLIRMPQYFSWPALVDGLKFHIPKEGLLKSVSVFGIIGVGASELFMYPYWCVEKGYARFAGRQDGTAAWQSRARGWIRVMHADIFASMVIYTVATLAFYLLGAGVLHGLGLAPEAKEREVITVLSNMYTQTLGPWALWLFYAGAIATLYGTIFAASAANARVFADVARLMGQFKSGDYATRVKYRNAFVVIINVIPVCFYFFFKAPVKMVFAGGLAQFLMLPIIGIATIYLHHRRLPPELRPSKFVTVALWVVTAVITYLMGYYVVTALRAS